MAEFARVNGSGFYAQDTLYSTSQQDAYLIATGVDLSGETGVEGAIEAIIREVSPLMYMVQAGAGGQIHIVADNHHNDAATLQARIRNLGDSVGTGGVDLTSTTVTLAGSIVAAAGNNAPVQTGDS